MSTMKAALVSEFGSPDDVLQVKKNQPRPEWIPNKKKLLIRVEAVSLSPSDYRLTSGKTDLVKKPKNGFPFIPGADVCGIVEASDDKSEFQVGDRVVGSWELFGEGALAEYYIVDEKYTARLPEGLSAVEGAALANSASHALGAVKAANIPKYKKGARVMVLGGSGGVGTIVIQLLRRAGARYIATTSTDEDLMNRLGVDRFIDYREEQWTDLDEFRDDPFDIVIDCAEGETGWRRARKAGVVKTGSKGGRWIAVIPRGWDITIHSVWQMIKFMAPVFGRGIWTFFGSPWTVRWKMAMFPVNPTTMTEVFKLAASNKIKTIIDPESPHPFTTQGVRDAYNKHIARRGHGKIVIAVDEGVADTSTAGSSTTATGTTYGDSQSETFVSTTGDASSSYY